MEKNAADAPLQTVNGIQLSSGVRAWTQRRLR
jgi:hypothetical protein